MKKSFVTVVVLAMVLGSLVGAEAKPKKKKAKPIATTLYAHGETDIGNQQVFQEFPTANFMDLDAIAPTGTNSKRFIYGMAGAGGVGTPNINCAGNSFFPVFVGSFAGRVTGDMKFTFGVESSPGDVEVRVWPDVVAQACNESYIPPAAATIVSLPGGPATVTAEFTGVDFAASAALMVQVTPLQEIPKLGAVLYDSTSDPTKLELTCTPASGATSCIPS